MAGAGFKVFNTGDVLTASDVNTFLQQQTVMVFASSAARTSALSGVLAEGMVTYLQDTNSVQVYNGTAFVAVGGSSPLTTKGDLYTFSTVDARLPVGTNGQVLTADSTAATGLAFTTISAGGMTLLSTTTLSGASTTISSISGSHNDLVCVVFGATNATANGNFRCFPNNLSSSTGTFFYGGDGSLLSSDTVGHIFLFNGTTDNQLLRTSASNAATFVIKNYASTTAVKTVSFNSGGMTTNSNPNTVARTGWGLINTTSAITSLVFSNTGGSHTAGTVLLYGVK